MALRNTAANRVVTEDMQIPALVSELDEAMLTITAIGRDKLVKSEQVEALKAEITDLIIQVERHTIAGLESRDAKVTQEAIKRAVKQAIEDDSEIQAKQANLVMQRQELERLNLDYDEARYEHRGAIAKLNAAAASLNFLGESKSARALVASILREI